MPADDLVIKSRRVVSPQGLAPGALIIAGGRVESVAPYDRAPQAGRLLDVGDSVVMPGLVDAHVHLNDPGRAEWEGFETGTRAAAAGGVTTVLDMPLNCIPVTASLDAFRRKLAAAQGRLSVDAGFWGGVVPGNEAELEPMMDAGVLGFKCFLIDSGIPEFPPVTEADLRKAMPILAERKVPLLAHAELCGAAADVSGEARGYARYLASRPKAWENDAIELLARLSAELRCRVHIVHLSSSEALRIIARARRKGAALTVETCPHYLTFAAEDVPEGRTEFKCAPPIRERANREALWGALPDGHIDFIVSDHSPCAPELKKPGEGDFMGAWGGVSGLQFTLSALWTEASRRGFRPEDISLWTGRNPARFADIGLRKGRLAPGCDADVVVWDPEAEFTVEPGMIEHRHKVTPYRGRALKGRVRKTFLRGVEVFDDGRFPVPPSGRAILRTENRHELR